MLNGPSGSRHSSLPSAVNAISPKSWKNAYTAAPSVTGDSSGLPARHLAPPQLLAGRAVEREHDQRLAVDARHEDARARQHGRRVARRHRGFPYDVCRRAELGRQPGGVRDARSVGSAKAGPVGIRCAERQRDEAERDEFHHLDPMAHKNFVVRKYIRPPEIAGELSV
jgi:hypothetical protein